MTTPSHMVPTPATDQWRKSSYSGAQNECLEVADLGGWTGIRDSKCPQGPALVVPAPAWRACLALVKG